MVDPSPGAYGQGREGAPQPRRLKGQGSSCPLPPNPCSPLSVGPVVPVSAICCLVLKQTNSQARGLGMPQPCHPFTSAASGGGPLPDQKQLRVRVAPGLCPLWALGELGGGCGGTGHAGLSAASSVNLPLPVAQGLPAVPHLGPSAVRGRRWGPDGCRLGRLHPGGPHPAVP